MFVGTTLPKGAISVENAIEVQYIDRVKHVYSHHRTNDEELAYVRTIDEMAESIEIQTADDKTSVVVFTPQTVYHFTTFRADYIGHASRTLIEALEHFRVRIPIEFVTAHQTFTIYVNGSKIVAGEQEYSIALRGEIYELVEPVQWFVSSAALDTILRLANEYTVQPVELVESAVGVFSLVIDLAEQHQVTPDEILSTLMTLVNQQRQSEPIGALSPAP
ncbi:MAG: hypothetical protein K6T83_00295 [Alicyclobacillus sp.]|nr:hypothetical protein [Alicyclobacillus sp.]